MDYQEFDKAVEYLRRYRDIATLKQKAYSSTTTPGEGIRWFEKEFREAGEEIETLNKLLLELTQKIEADIPEQRRALLTQADEIIEPLLLETVQEMDGCTDDTGLRKREDTLIFLARAAKKVCCRPTQTTAQKLLELVELMISDNLTIEAQASEDHRTRVQFTDKLFNTCYAEFEIRKSCGYWFLDSYKFF